jgi:hypothetical protein
LFAIRKVGQRKTLSGQRKTLSGQRKTLSSQRKIWFGFQKNVFLSWLNKKLVIAMDLARKALGCLCHWCRTIILWEFKFF